MSVRYTLGDVKLAYAHFEWRKYRGAIAEEAELQCPAEHFQELASFAKGLGGKPTVLKVQAPSKPGADPTTTSIVIAGIYIDRVIKQNERLCRVILFDQRFALSRVVQSQDFNVRFGDGYLDGTVAGSYRTALNHSMFFGTGDAPDMVRSLMAPGFVDKLAFVEAKDQLQGSGQSLPVSVAELSNEGSADLCVNTKGQLYFAARSDIKGAKLPSKNSYSWEIEPGWEAADDVVLGVPKEIRVFYLERHCLRVRAFDPSTTLNFPEPAELRVELEQVYSIDGHLWTLSEMLANNGFASSLLTDADIARSFWTASFKGSGLEQFHGSFEFNKIHNAVRNDWRRLWRVKFNNAKGHIGGWSDWTFGKIQVDGSTIPQPVECPYVSFLTNASPASAGTTGFVGSKASVTHGAVGLDTQAPFMPVWEGDESSGVIRLQQKADADGNLMIPGELEKDLVIEARSNASITDGAGGTYNLNDYFVIEREDVSKAQFKTRFEIVIFMCATRRMPNNRTRWHEEKIANIKGDIPFIELPVQQDLLCIRDFVYVNLNANQPQKDGLGPVLNGSIVKANATQRANAWLTEHAYARSGGGVAESIMLFKDFEIDGPIQEIALVCEGQKITTRMTVGNLADGRERKRRADSNRVQKRWRTAGAK